MRSNAQPRSKKPLGILAGTLLLVAAPFGMAVAPSSADGTNGEVCEGLASGKIDVTGDPATVTMTAPEGQLITRYCIKAGSSANEGDGPVYVVVEEPANSITVGHPSNKDVSHYSFEWAPADDTTTTTTTTGTTTTTTTTTAATETTTATATVTETEETEVLGEQTQTPKAQEEQTPKAQEQAPQVLGEQAAQPDVEEAAAPEVMGAQASVPSSVSAGLEASPARAAAPDTRLWWAAASGLLALLIGLGLASTRQAGVGFAGRHLASKGR